MKFCAAQRSISHKFEAPWLQRNSRTYPSDSKIQPLQNNPTIFNPLSPNSDQHQISPCNINAYSTPEVMRIKDMITQGEFSWYFITSPQYFCKKSMGTR